MKSFLLALTILVTSSVTQGSTLSRESRLYKLSQTLRNQPLSAEEVKHFSGLPTAGERDRYIKFKTKEFLQSQNFAMNLELKLLELFWMTLPTLMKDFSQPSRTDFSSNPNINDFESTLNYLFRSLALENKPWHELLVGKDYRIYGPTSKDQLTYHYGRPSGYTFYKSLHPRARTLHDEILESGGNSLLDEARGQFNNIEIHVEDISFERDNNKIAGAITTPRFFERYTNSTVNENRKRAAAVFRIFMCDQMAAQVPENMDALPESIKSLMFPGQAKKQSHAETVSDLHGERPDCMTCHFKLDPAGDTFRGIVFELPGFSAGGRLTYKDAQGRLYDAAVQGLGALANEIVKQPQYKRCQVKHLWSWFSGVSRDMTSEEEERALRAFDETGARTQDFVEWMVNQSQFVEGKKVYSDKMLTFSKVKNVFRRCTDCHDSMNAQMMGGFVPKLDRWPVHGNVESSKTMATIIYDVLDVGGHGAKATMPPSYSSWQLNLEERQLLVDWFSMGAPISESTDLFPRGLQR